MKEKIKHIIQDEIPSGCIFDAHSIIEYLIQCYSDIYLSSYTPNHTTATYHSWISSVIDEFSGNILQRQNEQSWSRNIHNNFSTNACWKKL